MSDPIAVPVGRERLQQLVEQWRASAKGAGDNAANPRLPVGDQRQCFGVAQAFAHCADELASALSAALAPPPENDTDDCEHHRSRRKVVFPSSPDEMLMMANLIARRLYATTPNVRLLAEDYLRQRAAPAKEGAPVKTIKIPDIEGPTAQLCWSQDFPTAENPVPHHPMVRCDRKKGHSGPHSWDFYSRPVAPPPPSDEWLTKRAADEEGHDVTAGSESNFQPAALAPTPTKPRCRECGDSGMVAYWDGSAYAGEMCPNASHDEAALAPPVGPTWRCFHCGMVLTTEDSARRHFGETRHDLTECQAVNHPAVLAQTRDAWVERRLARDVIADLVDACYAEGSSSSWRVCQVCNMEHRPDEAMPSDQTHEKDCIVDAAERWLRAYQSSRAPTGPTEKDEPQWERLKIALDDDRLSDRKLFPIALLGGQEPDWQQPCESECNPYVSKCGARFCSFADMTAHEAKCPAPPRSGVSGDKEPI